MSTSRQINLNCDNEGCDSLLVVFDDEITQVRVFAAAHGWKRRLHRRKKRDICPRCNMIQREYLRYKRYES